MLLTSSHTLNPQFEIMLPKRAPRVRAALSATTKQQIRNAHAANVPSQAQKTTEGRFILLAGNKKLTLLYPDGIATAAGRFYYEELLKLPIPELYPYEAVLEDEK
jgi:hypothetical protein